MKRIAMKWKNTTPYTMKKNITKKAKLLLVLFAGIVAAHASAETVTYYATDQLGSPIAAMDSSGSLLWWESYNPYGEKRRSPSLANGDTGYTGHQHDSATGLTYMQARYYDPVIGRFLANDPVGFQDHLGRGNSAANGFSRYAYANNNPNKYIDPDGEFGIMPTFGSGTVRNEPAEIAKKEVEQAPGEIVEGLKQNIPLVTSAAGGAMILTPGGAGKKFAASILLITLESAVSDEPLTTFTQETALETAGAVVGEGVLVALKKVPVDEVIKEVAVNVVEEMGKEVARDALNDE